MTTEPEIDAYTAAVVRCAEVRQAWSDRPENQRPHIRDHIGSIDWWSRWMASPEKAHCDMLLREALRGLSAPTTLPSTQNAL